MSLYIYDISSVSPQHPDSEDLNESVENKLKVIEPSYEGIPNNVLRRMGKAVKMSVGAALPLLKKSGPVNGIIIGTANGGMEDCIKFMNQIVQFNEGLLTPANFVQSTPNGIAAQLGLSQHNTGYNITHTHRGLSFENAAIDALMLLEEFPETTYLLGAADEISTYNYNVDFLDGWYKKEIISNKELFLVDSPASIAGEGAAMFLVGADKTKALAQIKAIHTLHSEQVEEVIQALKKFLQENSVDVTPELLITGENGDNRLLKFYKAAENIVPQTTGILRFKHASGEFPTAAAQAVALACRIFQTSIIPKQFIKKEAGQSPIKTILIYNTYKGSQHSFMLLTNHFEN